MTRRQFNRTPRARTLMVKYTHDNFEQIAAAIGMEAEAVAKHATLFEAAARWYRLDSASPDRIAPAESSIKSRRADAGY